MPQPPTSPTTINLFNHIDLFNHLDRLQDFYDRKSWEWDLEKRNLQHTKTELQHYRELHADAVETRDIVQESGILTQTNLRYHIETLVNEALKNIWGMNAYQFRAKFVKRRNQIECDLRLVRDDIELNPLEAAGGGVCDVVSMALRMVHHGLSNTIPVMAFDEPLRHLSRDLQERAAVMRNELRRLLGLQFIIVTHSEEAISGADRVFEFSLHNGRTRVEVVENG